MGQQVTVKCLICGKEEQKYPSAAKRYKTCSLECRGKLSSKTLTTSVEKTCEHCGQNFKVKPSHYESRKTCSRECRKKRKDGYVKYLVGKTGENCANWRGGRYVNKYGYVMIYKPENPMANSRGYVREHRYVMSEHMGRYLTDEEEVHHIDGNKQNNDITNLQILSKSEHAKLHHELRRSKKGGAE